VGRLSPHSLTLAPLWSVLSVDLWYIAARQIMHHIHSTMVVHLAVNKLLYNHHAAHDGSVLVARILLRDNSSDLYVIKFLMNGSFSRKRLIVLDNYNLSVVLSPSLSLLRVIPATNTCLLLLGLRDSTSGVSIVLHGTIPLKRTCQHAQDGPADYHLFDGLESDPQPPKLLPPSSLLELLCLTQRQRPLISKLAV
jgi:hypothetical protein